MRTRTATATTLLAIALLAGCAGNHGSTATPPSSSTSPSTSPSGYADMEKKVAAAESALAQADKDAAKDDTDR
ncbi:hypothetical protein LXH13_27190 [Streptomyces spinosirectus]|jgi:hypothetical protein|uniref:hypothetical protein n=1 Tax=Streptomyces TaxID=1883 RepID=UPI000D3ACFC3|nr:MULTISPECIES: hypothetical protein [Streptomyces]MBY8342635.1 hypothetical protein [Streptomyces plumbidurans]PTM87695.1 hypothetical protein C7821_115141 [Streptomyces sp. VMFN-G11Ma]UIR20492.1 hypothetical protein LXH13_27190 [Streptomyces spinosirectus]